METTIIEALSKDGWNFEKVSGGIYRTNYNNAQQKYLVQLNLINFEKAMILGTSFFPFTVGKDYISKAAWQLNAINLLVSAGSFQVDMKSGEISYRAGIYFFNTPFQMDMARNVMNEIVSYSNKHYARIQEIVQ